MRLPPSTRRWAVLVILLGLALLLMPAIAHARAGGGEGFHSDGGGGGGGHGGGGGSGGGTAVELVYYLFRLIYLCVRYPAFGVPFAIVVTIIVVYLWRSQQQGATTLLPPPMTDPRAVERLRTHDPAFDPDAFAQRVTAGFLKLQEAWCRQDLSAVRPFISDGVHERFSIQFAEQKAAGYRDRMEEVSVDSATVADAASGAVYDTVAVRVRARARDYKVALTDGRPLAGSRAVEPFGEVWSFLRRRGAATVPGKPGLLEGNCPNCAAPIQINESTNCASCGALLRSGEHDWVLAEITQESEWHPGGAATVPGLDRLRQRDPDLNLQAIEDRTSVVFWRRVAADRVGKVDRLRKAATDDYCKTVAGQLRPGPDARRRYTGECAVGSVDTVGFIPSSDPAGMDRAVVDVYWTGHRFTVAGDGQPPRAGPEVTQHTLFVLGRRADAKTDVAKGISSAHCPQCGAPESGGVGGACEFCGAVLNDGSTGWVLVDIQPADGPAAYTLREEIVTTETRRHGEEV
jgi:hypothetical protein